MATTPTFQLVRNWVEIVAQEEVVTSSSRGIRSLIIEIGEKSRESGGLVEGHDPSFAADVAKVLVVGEGRNLVVEDAHEADPARRLSWELWSKRG